MSAREGDDAAHVLGFNQNASSAGTAEGFSNYTRSMRHNARVSSTSNVLGKRTTAGKSNLLKTSSMSPEERAQRIQAVNSQNRIVNTRVGNIVMYNSKKMGLGRQ